MGPGSRRLHQGPGDHSKSAAAYRNRGLVYANKKENDLAIAEYTKAIGLAPRYASAYFDLARYARSTTISHAAYAAIESIPHDEPTATGRRPHPRGFTPRRHYTPSRSSDAILHTRLAYLAAPRFATSAH